MEQNFQTSFIPKKPIIKENTGSGGGPVSFFVIISILVFITMVVVSVGMVVYKKTLTTKIKSMENDLVLANKRFELQTISELKLLDRRLVSAKEILSKHIAISPLFKELQNVTLKNVRYNNFSYDISQTNTNTVLVRLTGEAVGYRSIALQAEVLAKNPNFINPVFSNLSLGQRGNVSFNLDFGVDRSFFDYKRTIQAEVVPDAPEASTDNTLIPNTNTSDTSPVLNNQQVPIPDDGLLLEESQQ